MPPKLSPRTQRHIDELFAADQRPGVESILTDECGTNLPLIDEVNESEIERIRIAALKMSGGDLAKLQEAVEIAQVDWRDLLVAAGFGSAPLAHERWNPASDR